MHSQGLVFQMFCTISLLLPNSSKSTCSMSKNFLLTDDSNTTERLMTDFSNFCSNRDGLLEEFWRFNSRSSEVASNASTEDEV